MMHWLHLFDSFVAACPKQWLDGTEDFKNTIDNKTSQELRMLSSVTINCQITKIVMNSGSQLLEL